MDLADLIVFLIGWLICSIVWAFWLDGIYVPAAGLVTVLGAIGAFKIILNVRHR